MKRLFTMGIILVLLLAGVGAVSANIVQNPGFESPDVTVPFVTYESSTNLDGWNVIHIDHCSELLWDAAEGQQSLDLSSGTTGSISQSLSTTQGDSYDLSFALAGNPAGDPKIKNVEVFWGGVSQGIFTFDTTGKSYPNNLGWTTVVVPNLIAPSASTELKFVSLDDTAYGPTLDNVVVDKHAIPSPEFPSMALPAGLIVGLIGVILFIQKSKDN